MKKSLIIMLGILGLTIIGATSVSASSFCAGFEEGYRTIKGNMAIVPMCPIEPITPIGSNAYQEGLKAGMRAAQGGH